VALPVSVSTNLAPRDERAAYSAVHLRHATQAVGVLDARIIFKMRFSDLAVASNSRK